MISSASCERAFEEEKERLRTKKRASSSVDRPGGPYPRSLHGHYTDLKGRTWNPCKCDQSSWPWLGRPHMIKYNCKGPFPNASVVFWKSRKEGLKNNSQRRERKRSCVCVCVLVRERKKKRRWNRQEIKVWLTSFKPGLVFTCTHWAERLCWQIKYVGVQGQTRHTRMIDGSVWMLKSTEPEHVSAAQPRPSTQHLFKGQVLQNTLAAQLLLLSYQISHTER